VRCRRCTRNNEFAKGLLSQERTDPADGEGTNIGAVGSSKRSGEDRTGVRAFVCSAGWRSRLTEATRELGGVWLQMVAAQVKTQWRKTKKEAKDMQAVGAHPAIGGTTLGVGGAAMGQGRVLAIWALIAGTTTVSDRLAEELAILAEQEKWLGAEIARLERPARQNVTLDLAAQRENIAIAEKTLRKIAVELEALEIERESSPRISLREAASGPEDK
jgi:hypothetical protein